MALTTAQLRVAWAPACRGPWVTIPLHGAGKVTVRPAIKDAVLALNRILVAYNYRTRRADTGAYVCRNIAGTNRRSLHAYGIALDINWQSNPMRRPLTTDMPTAMIRDIETIRTNNGRQVWRWGGRFSTPDAMHFEVCCAPADLATGIRGTNIPTPLPVVPNDEEIPVALVRRTKTGGVYEIAGNSIRPLAGATLAYKERFARLVGKPLQILPVPEADWAAVTANLTDSRTGTRFDHNA